MTRDMETRPYSPDELRVVEYIQQISGRNIGAGDDPIGFLLAAHAMAIRDMLSGGRLPLESAVTDHADRQQEKTAMTDTMQIFGAEHPSFPVVVRDVKPTREFEIVTPGVLRILGSTITITVRGTEFVVTYGASPGGPYATLATAKTAAVDLLNDLQQMGLEP